MEPFACPLGLRDLGLRPHVADVLHRRVELVPLPLQVSTVLRSPIRQYPVERNAVRCARRGAPCRRARHGREWGLPLVEFHENDLGLGIDGAANALASGDVKRVLSLI